MAELTGGSPRPDMVTCVCGEHHDRNIYSQCPRCFANLWELQRVMAPEPARESDTVLEPHPAQRAHLDIFVGGRRFTLHPGKTVRLGREESLETEDIFRDAMNVSRKHAELRFDGERLFVTDTGSSNGTYVSDQQLPAGTEYELRPGQTLRLASNVAVQIDWEN